LRNDCRRAALQDGLISSSFPCGNVVTGNLKWSEQRRSLRQIALRLRDCRLLRERINVVRRDIENLIEFPIGFSKVTKTDIGKRVLREQVNVARVESFSFVEIGLTLIPLASPACDIGKIFRDPAAIREELTRLLEITRAGVIIL